MPAFMCASDMMSWIVQRYKIVGAPRFVFSTGTLSTIAFSEMAIHKHLHCLSLATKIFG